MIHKIGETKVGYKFNAEILTVYDGDGTFWIDLEVVVDIGYEDTITSSRKKPARMWGIDTPELKSSNDAHKRAGYIVRDFVRDLILGKNIVLHSKEYEKGKFGRILVDIEIEDKMLSEILLEKGFAKPYDGGKKDEWSMQEIDNIVLKK